MNNFKGRKDLSITSNTTDSSSQIKKNLSEQLEKNRLLILNKIDQMNNINQKLKNDYVPVTVINNLTQSIKEVEVNFLLNEIKSKMIFINLI